jgi:endonuclease/exonuclease/phosphatase family metal-dependent hydrolase
MKRVLLGLVAVAFGSAEIPPASAEPPPERLVVATWNLEWFYDHHTGDNFQDVPRRLSAPTADDWEWKLTNVARAIAQIRPTILALQEVENRRVLFQLTRQLKTDHGQDYSVAYIEGNDTFTEQDVAVLAHSGLTSFTFKRQTKEMFDSLRYYNVSKHIFCHFEWTAGNQRFDLLVVNVHFRAAPQAAAIRTRQARLIRHWIADTLKVGRPVIVLGDINTEETHTAVAPASDLGTLLALATPATDDDLIDVFTRYQGAHHETHLIHKQFDHILASPSLITGKSAAPAYRLQTVAIRRDLVIRGRDQDKDHGDNYWKIPAAERDISDHYPVVAEFTLAPNP